MPVLCEINFLIELIIKLNILKYTVKNYNIKKISELKSEKLIAFYKKAFKERSNIIIDNYNWCYRKGYNSFEPIVLIIDEEIIGHAGLIPSELNINGKIYQFIWFTDFIILPEFRKKNYGQILTQEWMKICSTQITFCNDHSLKIFKKFRWGHNLSVKRVIKPINLFNNIPVLNYVKNNFINNIYKSYIRKKIYKVPLLSPKIIDNKTIKILTNAEKKINNDLSVFLVRDENWFTWRLMDCPYKENIRVFECDDNYIIVNIYKYKNLKRLNIIYYLFQNKKSHGVVDIVTKWSLENNIDFIWYSINDKNKDDKSLKTFSFLEKKLNFAFNSTETEIKEFLQNGIQNSQGIDSDIDFNSI